VLSYSCEDRGFLPGDKSPYALTPNTVELIPALGQADRLFALSYVATPEKDRANMAHIRRSGPGSGLRLPGKVLKTFLIVPLKPGRV